MSPKLEEHPDPVLVARSPPMAAPLLPGCSPWHGLMEQGYGEGPDHCHLLPGGGGPV